MAEGVQSDLIQAAQVIQEATVRHAANGIRYAAFGDNNLNDRDLERMVQAVPIAIAGALARKKSLRLSRVPENPVVDERVVQHEICRAKVPDRLACQQGGIPGAGAD